MRKLFEGLTARLQAFIEQRDALTLLVRCQSEECVYLAKALDGIDEASQDVFWSFAASFRDAASYADEVVSIVRGRAEALSPLLEEAGARAWPPLPARVLDGSAPPAQRLQLLFMYLRTRIEDTDASKIVVVLAPLENAQPIGWRVFVQQLTAYDTLAPWCHHMRFIVREPKVVSLGALPPDAAARVVLEAFEGTEVYEMDFSLAALHRATKEDVGDESLPLPDRMQMLLLDANVDVANKRWEEASAKLKLLQRYYEAIGQQGLLSVTLNSIGEVLVGIGRGKSAVASFEAALDHAIASDFRPVVLNVSLNLGNFYLARKEWGLASAYYEAAEAVAAAALNAPMKLQCLENIGWCKLNAEDYRGAEQAWSNGATLARAVTEPAALRRLLTRLRDLYDQARMRDRLVAVDAELAGLSDV